MKTPSRRTFLKQLGQGTLRASAVPLFGANLLSSWKAIGLDDLQNDTEEYWELVKAQFNFAEELHYFNNASLGASSTHIQQ